MNESYFNLGKRPKKCQMKDCDNKAYAKDKLTIFQFIWVCRKHYEATYK